MFHVSTDWNPKQAKLRELILSPDRFDEAMQLCFELHSIVHCSVVSQGKKETLFDEIWEGLTKEVFMAMPTLKDVTIAWNIWHITRIEDVVTNTLMAETGCVLDDEWLERLSVGVRDTGNAMTDDEIISFSASVNMEELRNYRNAVGIRTREVLSAFSAPDMRRKVKKESTQRILTEGGVTSHADSIWLLDFWGAKNIAGLILMPITRHQIMHLNDCIKLKKGLL